MALWCLLISPISDSTIAKSGITDHLSLLDQQPSSLWEKSSTDIGRIHSVLPIKIKIDPSKALPRINQYPIRKEALQGIMPIIKDYKSQDLIMPCTSPCNALISPVRKPINSGPLLPSIIDEAPLVCLTLTNHLLMHHDDLQKTLGECRFFSLRMVHI